MSVQNDWFTKSYHETSFDMGYVPVVELDKKGKAKKKKKMRPLQKVIYSLPVFALAPMTAFAEGTTTTVPRNEEMQKKMMEAFMPIIELAQAMAYPVALLVVMCGGLFILIGKDKGWDMMQRAGLGYVLIMILPMLLNVLVDAMQSMV